MVTALASILASAKSSKVLDRLCGGSARRAGPGCDRSLTHLVSDNMPTKSQTSVIFNDSADSP